MCVRCNFQIVYYGSRVGYRVQHTLVFQILLILPVGGSANVSLSAVKCGEREFCYYVIVGCSYTRTSWREGRSF
jgi:hypothetical protein